MNTIAEIILVDKNKAVVISNNIQLTVKKDKLEFTAQKVKRKKRLL